MISASAVERDIVVCLWLVQLIAEYRRSSSCTEGGVIGAWLSLDGAGQSSNLVGLQELDRAARGDGDGDGSR